MEPDAALIAYLWKKPEPRLDLSRLTPHNSGTKGDVELAGSPAFDGEALAPEIAVGLLGGAVVDGTVPGDDGVDEVAVHGAGGGFETFSCDMLF
jgi:hypothetical protein